MNNVTIAVSRGVSAEEITKYGSDFSGEWVIVTPKGGISSALLWHTAAPTLSLLPSLSPRLVD